jgi:hypothetical protein
MSFHFMFMIHDHYLAAVHWRDRTGRISNQPAKPDDGAYEK